MRIVTETPDIVASYFEILELIQLEFQLRDSYIRDGVPTFIIVPDPRIKEKMDRLRVKLQMRGFDMILRDDNGELVLSAITMKPTVRLSSDFSRILPFILLFATVITVTISGYISANSHIALIKLLGKPIPSRLKLTAMYTVSIMGVLGLHELGHLIACRKHNVKASIPLFIPGIPGITPGTFGAIIRQENPRNRDQLFDIGFSGPLLGFIVALVVSYFGYSWSVPVSEVEYLQVMQTMGGGQIVFLPTLFMLLGKYILPNPNSYTHFLHPIAWAGWICTFITFLNAFPIGQLDGGHISRALLGRRWHQRLSYIMIGVMVLVGWWPMALLTLFVIRPFHPGVLDDTTEVTKERKIAGIFFILIFVACFTLSPESPLLMLFFR